MTDDWHFLWPFPHSVQSSKWFKSKETGIIFVLLKTNLFSHLNVKPFKCEKSWWFGSRFETSGGVDILKVKNCLVEWVLKITRMKGKRMFCFVFFFWIFQLPERHACFLVSGASSMMILVNSLRCKYGCCFLKKGCVEDQTERTALTPCPDLRCVWFD